MLDLLFHLPLPALSAPRGLPRIMENRQVTLAAKNLHSSCLCRFPRCGFHLSFLQVSRVGLKCIGDIVDLPRAPLTARFASDVLRQLDRALGYEHEPLTPRLPVAPYVAEQRFAE